MVKKLCDQCGILAKKTMYCKDCCSITCLYCSYEGNCVRCEMKRRHQEYYKNIDVANAQRYNIA